MANYADVTLRIYGEGANKLNHRFGSMVSSLSAEYMVKELKNDFTDESKLELIDEFLKNGDKRFDFIVFNSDDDFIELAGQSAWSEPYDFIRLISDLYDTLIYHLVYEPSCEIYQTNDIDGTIFGDYAYKYALDCDGNYGPISEDALIAEAEDYYESDFFDADDVWEYYSNALDPHEHEDDDKYFYLLKLERVVY